MPSVAVVGGGIAGLTVAHQLRRRSPTMEVAVLERSAAPGGVIGTFRDNGRLVELGPNGFLDSKPEILAICDQVGLTTELERARPEAAERFVLAGNQLRRVPKTPGEFLINDVLSLGGKIRFLWERLCGRASGADDESIADFGRRHFGREATEVLVDAVTTGIFAGDIEKLSVRSCFPRLVELERRFSSLLKAQGALAKEKRTSGAAAGLGTLTAPRGGMGRFIERLQASVGDHIKCGVGVERVERTPRGWRIIASENAWETDAVVLAVPANAAATMLADVDAPLAEELNAIRSAPAVVVALAVKRVELPKTPVGFGYLAPERLGRPVLGVIYSSNVFDAQAPVEEFMFRAILGGDRRRDVIDWNDGRLIQAVRDDLRSLLGIGADPTFRLVQRWKDAIPQYHVGHAAALARLDQRLQLHAGLYLTGASYRGIAAADCVKDAMAVADEALQYVESVKPGRVES